MDNATGVAVGGSFGLEDHRFGETLRFQTPAFYKHSLGNADVSKPAVYKHSFVNAEVSNQLFTNIVW